MTLIACLLSRDGRIEVRIETGGPVGNGNLALDHANGTTCAGLDHDACARLHVEAQLRISTDRTGVRAHDEPRLATALTPALDDVLEAARGVIGRCSRLRVHCRFLFVASSEQER